MRTISFLLVFLPLVACDHDRVYNNPNRAAAQSRINMICRAIASMDQPSAQLTSEELFGRLIALDLIRADDFFNDPWGSRYRVNSKSGIVYSIGENKVDEDGAGDDIFCAIVAHEEVVSMPVTRPFPTAHFAELFVERFGWT